MEPFGYPRLALARSSPSHSFSKRWKQHVAVIVLTALTVEYFFWGNRAATTLSWSCDWLAVRKIGGHKNNYRTVSSTKPSIRSKGHEFESTIGECFRGESHNTEFNWLRQDVYFLKNGDLRQRKSERGAKMSSVTSPKSSDRRSTGTERQCVESEEKTFSQVRWFPRFLGVEPAAEGLERHRCLRA
jgi:hypothetical protein